MDLLQWFDYFGVFVFAITGAMLAARKEMDVFGFVVLALMPAIGGGTLRDLILGEPVFWLSDTTYLFVTLTAALVTFFAVRFMTRLSDVLLWFDALGLSVFCAIGAAKAMAVTGDPVIGVVMGAFCEMSLPMRRPSFCIKRCTRRRHFVVLFATCSRTIMLLTSRLYWV